MLGKNLFQAVREESICFPETEPPKTNALYTASLHCLHMRRRLQVVSVEETQPPYTAENPKKAQILFTCIETGETESTYDTR